MIDDSRLRDDTTTRLFYGQRVRALSGSLAERAQNKLKLVFAASKLQDLAVPPGNRLEVLKGDRKGQWSIRINDRWRVCFVWDGSKAVAIEVVDYH